MPGVALSARETASSVNRRTTDAPTVLLVAGPAGAGKSTFTRLLWKRQLPEEILARLPAGSHGWPHFDLTHCIKHEVCPEAAVPGRLLETGVVLHYSIGQIHSHGIPDYEHDPVAMLIARRECIAIVCITPPRDQLATQFASRAERYLSTKSWRSRVWAQSVRHPLRRVKRRLKGQPLGKLDHYKDRDWLERCYQQWDAFIREVLHDKPRASVLYLAPCTDGDCDPSFRLI